MTEREEGEIRCIESTTRITTCCEVEPSITITGETICPDCGHWDAETIGRVCVEYEVVE